MIYSVLTSALHAISNIESITVTHSSYAFSFISMAIIVFGTGHRWRYTIQIYNKLKVTHCHLHDHF